ncbi:MAG: hypothetical protein WCI41_01400 [bacterium]
MSIENKKRGKSVFMFFIYVFAFVGLTFAAVFLAMQFNLLNVKGSASSRNSYFDIKKVSSVKQDSSLTVVCRINALGRYAPFTAVNIYKTLTNGASDALLEQMISTASKRFAGDSSFESTMKSCDNTNAESVNLPMTAYSWADTDEWNLMKGVFIRDQEVIKKAAHDANISPRLLLGGVIGEQFRFFNNSRESFKKYFEPMKILASLSKFSFGIAGLKPETATLIEEHLKDKNSPYYLGPEMENVLDYQEGADVVSEQMSRITNSKDPYYSYLYVGLFMRQIEAQWAKAGYDISYRPEVLSTLYNLGFYRSVPKPDAQAGGAVINVGGIDYTFGDLGYEFYYSGELSDIFPLDTKQ